MLAQRELKSQSFDPCPPGVTRGAVTNLSTVANPQKTLIDTISVTSELEVFDLVGKLSHLEPKALEGLVANLLPDAEMSEQTKGSNGFKHQVKLCHGQVILGWVAWGGEAMRGRVWVYLGGAGMRYRRSKGLTDDSLSTIEQDLNGRITRLDLALDLYHGELDLDRAYVAYNTGGFSRRGQDPSHRLFQSSPTPDGDVARTLYVGKVVSGKSCRIYDKGLQLIGSMQKDEFNEACDNGVIQLPYENCKYDDLKKWCRFEVQFNRVVNNRVERPVNPDAIINRDAHFAGAYDFGAEVIGRADGIRPLYIPEEQEVDLAKLILACRDSYGGVIFHMRTFENMTDSQIVARIIGTAQSKRLAALPDRVEQGYEI